MLVNLWISLSVNCRIIPSRYCLPVCLFLVDLQAFLRYRLPVPLRQYGGVLVYKHTLNLEGL